MLRKAGPADAAALEEFLAQYAETSMFLRGNLQAHGTQNTEHRHGTAFYLREDAGQIIAVGGITNGGYLTCQAPGQDADFWATLTQHLDGRRILGITGCRSKPRAGSRPCGWTLTLLR